MRPSRHPVPLGMALAVMLVLPPARALAGDTQDAFQLLHEEQTVTGAAKRPQPLSESPSAVTVITAAEIRAMGYHTVADALRWVRGLFVTDDHNYEYLGIRGVQRPGDYNDKVLLAVDGHTVNSATYGDAPIGEDLGVDLAQVDRIEVVRGPGSSLYGSYAVLAVVNVVTRAPSAAPTAEAKARVGSAGERRLFASTAGTGPRGASWTVSCTALDRRGPDLRFPQLADPLHPDGVAAGGDGEGGWAALARAEWGGWTATAKANLREKHVPTAPFGTVFGDDRTRTFDGRDYVELGRTLAFSPATELVARAWWNGMRYKGYYVYAMDSVSTETERDIAEDDVLGTEWRLHWAPRAGQVVTAGLEGSRVVRDYMATSFDAPPYQIYQGTTRDTRGAVYAQDEIRLGAALRLTAGARLDAAASAVAVLSPRADLSWRMGSGTSFKLLAGSAYREPSVYERYYTDGLTQIANQDLLPERTTTAEAELEHSAGPLTAMLSVYDSRIRDLIDFAPTADPAVGQFRNRQHVQATGVEGELRFVPSADTRVRLSTACQRTVDDATGAELSNSPRWNTQCVAVHALRGGRASIGAGVRYLSPRLTLARAWTAPVWLADARVAARATRWLTAGIEGRNLFDLAYADPGSLEHAVDQIPQDRRSLFLTLELARRGDR